MPLTDTIISKFLSASHESKWAYHSPLTIWPVKSVGEFEEIWMFAARDPAKSTLAVF